MHGDEQRVMEGLAFTQPISICCINGTVIVIGLGYFTRLGGDYDPCQISSMVCIKHLSVGQTSP